ncbi:MAG TPA: low molecular weight protein arginine phosphatase [Clostridiales bacterium]|jgi:protein-tyrosine phosphatase|nr:low molecular weight protein arginine phosphatase [Clostridiales bacterium]
MNILFVCTGNTCRSPMAEGLFNKRAQERAVSAKASSCGVGAWPGQKATENAVLAAANLGADISHHRARQASPEICQQADAIFCMSPSHKAFLVSAELAPEEKVFVFSPPVPDPFGQSLSVYEKTARHLYNEVEKLLDTILRGEQF